MNCSSPDDPLLAAARVAAGHAYCPHSGFPVGAAVQTADGSVFTGCNVENASYGVTTCAERVAVFAAVAAGAREIIRIAVCCAAGGSDPASRMPCGACLQVLSEFAGPEAEVLVDQVGTFRLADLAPHPFRLRT